MARVLVLVGFASPELGGRAPGPGEELDVADELAASWARSGLVEVLAPPAPTLETADAPPARETATNPRAARPRRGR